MLNDEGVCRTDSPTPGLLNTISGGNFLKVRKLMRFIGQTIFFCFYFLLHVYLIHFTISLLILNPVCARKCTFRHPASAVQCISLLPCSAV